MYLDFKVQQVAVDLVVNIGIILLLAQVQPWDVHRGLQAQQKYKITHMTHVCVHIFTFHIYKQTKLLSSFTCMKTQPGIQGSWRKLYLSNYYLGLFIKSTLLASH